MLKVGDGVVGVVDDDLARLGGDVGVAQLLDLSDHPPLGAQDVGGPAGFARRQVHGRNGALGDALVRNRAAPIDLGIGEHEDRSRRHLDHAARRVALGDVRLDGVGVIAFGPQHRDDILAGVTRPAAGLGAALRGGLGLREDAQDRLAKRLVLDPGDRRRGFVGERRRSRQQNRCRHTEG
jgi:hypothetical protein